MRDEVRCPAGLGSQPSHSGGAGAPPGPKMRSCQELADDPRVYSNAVRPVDFVRAGGRDT